LIDELTGRRCTTIRRFRHRLADQAPTETGPIELTWDDGTLLTLDAKADWSLDLSSRPWIDSYASASESEREALAREVGLWHEAPIPSTLGRLVGQAVTSTTPEFNEVGELAGLHLAFETLVVRARVVSGELSVEVLDR
jgi:hypothetical protein